jgi:cytochrome bd-type quinol oxidase subunit 1
MAASAAERVNEEPGFMELDPVLLSRVQFAFVISFHIIFPAFTIGLAAWLATLEGVRLWTGNELYRRIFDFWLKIFALSFGMGGQRHRDGLPVRHQLERTGRAHRIDPGAVAGL